MSACPRPAARRTRRAVRTTTALAAVAVATPLLMGTSWAAAPKTAPAPSPGATGGSAAAVLAEQVRAYKASYPTITDAAAVAAAKGQVARKGVVEAALASPGTYGGAWFDPPTGVLHLAVTQADAASRPRAVADAAGVRVRTHLVQRSFAQLTSLADRLRADTGELGRSAGGAVGISVETNAVVAAVPAARMSALASSATSGVTLVPATVTPSYEDAGCTSRNACDFTVRAGTTLWEDTVGRLVCSVGFTARNSFSRYVYTAGHCSSGNGKTWGTGQLPIGPMWASRNSGAIDASIIRVTNPWFTGDLGGQAYFEDADHSVDVDFEAPSLGYMVPGETVCLSANITQPNGPNYCGTLGTSSDASNRGLARVNGLDGCHGDSGGGWYWLGSSTFRVAYGLHSRSSFDGCHVAGGVSWFSALPTVKAGWVPSLAVETR